MPLGISTSSAPRTLLSTSVKTSAYAANPGELVPVNATSGSVVVTLPTAPADRAQIAVKLVAVSGSNTATVSRGGTDVFNATGGPTSLTLAALNETVLLQYATSGGIWYVISTDVPFSTLDTRYGGITVDLLSKTSNFSVASGEAGGRYHASSAGAITVTVPTNASDAIPVGSVFEIVRRGAGSVNISPASGVTLNSAYGYRSLARQYSAAGLVKVATNEWDLHGDLQ